jgi:hypothetical protein
MIQKQNYGDERQTARCSFCGGETGTRDHCPSRVLLNEPYPENLPVVPACSACNARFSSDEQYLACLISCVLAGSTDPAKIIRPKICRILLETPKLRARIEQSRLESADGIIFQPEQERVVNVVTKLARGHALYELNEPRIDAPSVVWFKPLSLMSKTERYEFESSSNTGLSVWPEVGSRAMQRVVECNPSLGYPWLTVQDGLYRFHASVDSGVSVRIIIHEYLACHVQWD